MMITKLESRYYFLIMTFFCLLLTSYTRDSLYALVIFSGIAWLIVPSKKYWNSLTTLLLLFSIMYSAVMWINGNVGSLFNQVVYLISPVIFFRLGYLFMDIFKSDRSREYFFLLVAIFFLAPIIYQTLVDIKLVGIVNPTRHLLSELSNTGMMSATLYGLMSSVGIGGVATLFVKCSNLKIKIGYLIIATLSLLIVVHLVNRTGIVLLLVCLIISFILSTKMKISKIVPVALIFVLLLVMMFGLDVVNNEVINAYEYRALNSESSESAGGRTELWINSLGYMFMYPFGWGTEHYSHNLWLDIARVSGLFAFVPFLCLTLVYVNKLLSLAKKVDKSYIIIVITMNTSMILASSVEPVIDASILYFSILMMMWGIVSKLHFEVHYRLM